MLAGGVLLGLVRSVRRRLLAPRIVNRLSFISPAAVSCQPCARIERINGPDSETHGALCYHRVIISVSH